MSHNVRDLSYTYFENNWIEVCGGDNPKNDVSRATMYHRFSYKNKISMKLEMHIHSQRINSARNV